MKPSTRHGLTGGAVSTRLVTEGSRDVTARLSLNGGEGEPRQKRQQGPRGRRVSGGPCGWS